MAGDTSKAAIGRRIAGLRNRRKLSQVRFAKSIGVPLANLIALEEGMELAG